MRSGEVEAATAGEEPAGGSSAPDPAAAASTASSASSAAATLPAEDALAVFDEVLERGSSPRWRVGLGAAIVLVLVAAAIAIAVAALRPAATTVVPGARATEGGISGPGPFGSTGASGAPGASGADDVPILVHVLGAVRAEGVYELPAGSRLVDAVAAAGGLAEDADASLVNLARTIGDGEQLRIPRVGEPPPEPDASGPTSGGGEASGAGTGADGAAGGTPPVNLNTATRAELETLPRIGPAMAQRILDHRAQHGPFASIDELGEVTGVGDATLEALRPLVTV